MTFEDVQIAISSLLTRMSNQPEDAHEVEFLLREKLNEIKAFGMPLPRDLVDLDAALNSGLTAGSQKSPSQDSQ